MRTETHELYVTGITRAISHILSHLDDPLDPQAVAREACFSTFYFHRIFRGLIGESIAEFIKRIRMERAAWRLRHGSAVTETAFEAGFDSHEAFTRAFRELFGIPPSEFRRRRIPVFELPNPTGLHFDPQGRPPIVRPLRSDATMQVDVRSQPAIRTAAIRHIGPYWQIGPVFGELCRWAEATGVPLRNGPAIRERILFAIYYDCPESTPSAEWRSDACVALPPDYQLPSGPVREVTIPAGTFAVGTYVGPYSGMHGGWSHFICGCLPQSGLEIGDGPNFECYVDDCEFTPVDRLRTELCVPLRRDS